MVYISFILKILLYQHFHTFFLVISHLFSHLFQKNIHYIIRLLRRYKNIYDLHRFPFENSSIIAISHLFWRFHTFSSHLFQKFFSLCTPPHSYQSIKKKVGQYLRRFSNFGWGHDFVTPTNDNDERRTTTTTPLMITIP